MNTRSILALLALTSVTVLSAACAAPPETDSEETAEAEQPMTGVPVGPTGGIVKILVPGASGTTTRTGVLVASNKVLTGLAAIPSGTALGTLSVDTGLSVIARADNATLGATLLTLGSNASGPVWLLNTAAPSGLIGRTVTCPGYDTAGTSLRAFGFLSGAASPGYQVTFTTGSIDTTDDGVPCYDDQNPSGGILGIALSTSGGVHHQVSAARLAPWIADPTMKTLSLTRSRYHLGTGTIATPASLTSCNSLAYGSTCSSTFMNQTTVTITTSPGPDSVTQWTGCTSSSGNTCTVSITGAKSVTARFVGCTNCYDDCITGCSEGPGGLPMSVCVPSCTSKCKGCGF